MLEQVLSKFRSFEWGFDRVETFEQGVIYLALQDEAVVRE